MPSEHFMGHQERKHSKIDRVPYVKLTNGDSASAQVSTAAASAPAAVAEPMAKCRYCPNRILQSAMDSHLQRCHMKCQLCGKTLTKSTLAKHMEQKHKTTNSNGMNGNSSKSSLRSDSSVSITASNGRLTGEWKLSGRKKPFQSDRMSSSSSISTQPSPPPWLSIITTATTPVKPSNHQLHQPQPPQQQQQLPNPNKSNIICVDQYQLSRLIRQGRVYKKDGWLYLRNSNNPM